MSGDQDFRHRSAAFAESLGAPAGTFAAVIRAGGLEVPIVGSVNGPGGPLRAEREQRLRRAREALEALERRQFRKW